VNEEERSAATTFVVESGRKERQMVHYNWWTNTGAEQMTMYRVNQIPAEMRCNVNEINAKAERARREAELEADRIRRVSAEQAHLAEVKVTSDVFKEAEVVGAEADMQYYRAAAECLKLEATAEDPQALAPKRAYEMAIAEAEKSNVIAKNEPLLFVGDAGDKLIGGMITGSLKSGVGEGGLTAHRLPAAHGAHLAVADSAAAPLSPGRLAASARVN